MNIHTLDEIKDEFYGQIGTPKRDKLEREIQAFRVGIKIREARKKMHLTQEQLAKRIGKKRSFISKVENDGSNITLTTLFDIVEKGLDGKVRIEVLVDESPYQLESMMVSEP